MSLLNKADLCQLIPHGGAMCLLATVEKWDHTGIVCTAESHHDVLNPLRNDGRLDAICSVEYAAQAMAVHIRLVAEAEEGPVRVGYIGSVRDVVFNVQTLDDLSGTMTVHAMRLFGEEGSFVYTFEVSVDEAPLVSGRASIFLMPRGGDR